MKLVSDVAASALHISPYAKDLEHLRKCLDASQAQEVFFKSQITQSEQQTEQLHKHLADTLDARAKTQRLIMILENLGPVVT